MYDLYNIEKEKNKGIKKLLEKENIPAETLIAEFERLEDLEDTTDELKILLKEEKEKNKKLLAGKFREVADKNSYIKDMYVSKDKIREKIENYKAYKGTVLYEKYSYEAIIFLLKELLEGD